MEIHAKTQTYNGILKQFLGCLLIESRERLSKKHGKSQTQEQYHRRSDPGREEVKVRHIISHEAECQY